MDAWKATCCTSPKPGSRITLPNRTATPRSRPNNCTRAGRRASLAWLLLSPLLRFIKFYFLRLGFLDGIPGLIHILIGCFNSFMKYAKLRELNRKSAR